MPVAFLGLRCFKTALTWPIEGRGGLLFFCGWFTSGISKATFV